MVGKEEYPEKRSVFGSRLPRNELIFCFSGRATVKFGELTLEDEPGSVRFLPKGEVSRYEVYRHEAGDCIDVFFKTDRPVAPRAFSVDVSKNERIGRLFKRIFTAWVAKEGNYYHECISLLYRIFFELEGQSYFSEEQFSKIKPAVEAIHNSFLYKTPTVSELSALCGISESYLKQLFNQKYGIPPKKYMIRLKIDHACDLLRTERYTVTQISEICNFSDVYFFSRQFKEYVGITPTQFVNKYRSSK